MGSIVSHFLLRLISYCVWWWTVIGGSIRNIMQQNEKKALLFRGKQKYFYIGAIELAGVNVAAPEYQRKKNARFLSDFKTSHRFLLHKREFRR